MPTEPPSPDNEPPPIGPPPRLEDVTSIDAITNAVYEALSFCDGAGPDGARLRSLMAANVRLQKVLASGRLVVCDLEAYLVSVRARVAAGLVAFHERELLRRTDVYGGIAQVFSSYEARWTAVDGEHQVQGINSLQLHNDGSRWWILSILWTDEEEGEPIPSAYLPRC